MSFFYTESEVSKHKTEQSCWLIIGDGSSEEKIVYDVTQFMQDHPGGPEILLEFAGKDATENFEHAKHSNDARNQMQEYRIGRLGIPETVSAFGEELYKAARAGNSGEVKRLLKTATLADIEYQHKGVIWNITPLMASLESKHSRVAQMLLDAGASVNTQEFRSGRTALMSAANTGSESLTRLLLDRPGVDTSLKTKNGQSAEDLTMEFKVKTLLRNYGKEVPKPEGGGFFSFLLGGFSHSSHTPPSTESHADGAVSTAAPTTQSAEREAIESELDALTAQVTKLTG